MEGTTGDRYSHLPDEALMQLFQSGNDEAFSEIVKRYESRLVRFLNRHYRHKQDNEDLIQDTFVRVFIYKNNYDCTRKFSHWIYTISLNQLRTHIRKNNIRITFNFPLYDDKDGYETIDPELLQDAKLYNSYLLDKLEKGLRQLSPISAKLLRMRALDGMMYKDISLATNLPIGTIKSRIGRARKLLKKIMRMGNTAGSHLPDI